MKSILILLLAAAFGATTLRADSPAQSLFEAIRQGDMAKVKAAIHNGVDVNSRDADGNTLLIQSALYGTPADLEFLLARGAAVNAANQRGHTALMRAMPHLDKIKLLVEHGAEVNAVSSEGNTPLLIAAHIRSGEEVVRYLMQNGADLTAIDGQGLDAVMRAAGQGAASTLKILLDAGASGASEAKNRPIPKTTRMSALDQEARDRLRRRAEGVTALMGAARADCEACVRLLLEHDADARAKTDAGLTALHLAAYKGNLAMVKLFMKAGAPVNAADDRGLTPLMMAANSKNKNMEVVELLLARGADTEAKDEFGRTAADWARSGGRGEIQSMLPAAATGTAKAPVRENAFENVHAAAAKSMRENARELL